MTVIRNYIQDHLLDPLKSYPTIMQDTLIEIIIEKLERLYEYTLKFPEILKPNQSRLDILKVIADQFLFTIREDADLQEQINILDNILYVYSRRGSIDTIENMWKYYGGDLPRDIHLEIPTYKVFRYNISALSGNHVFQDNENNRTGVYEVRLVNNTYPVDKLKEFMLKELVAAGNYIYFTNTIHGDILSSDKDTNAYKYDVREDYFHELQLMVPRSHQGYIWSGHSYLSKNDKNHGWSGRGSIYVNLVKVLESPPVNFIYQTYNLGRIDVTTSDAISEVLYRIIVQNIELLHCIDLMAYSTPEDSNLIIDRYLYNNQGEIVTNSFPGYFILGESLLGEEVV